MGVVLSVANQKGGVGKTLNTHNLAKTFALPPIGRKTLVIECDHQGTLIEARNTFLEHYPDEDTAYELIHSNIEEVPSVLEKEVDNYELIFIDIPGILEKEGIRTVMLSCDLMFIPIKPSESDYDVNSTITFLQKVSTIKQERDKEGYPFDAYAFVNMDRHMSKRGKEIRHDLDGNGIPRLECDLREYKLYASSARDFEPIIEYDKGSKPITDKPEIYQWYKFSTEVLKKIDEMNAKLEG